MAIGIFSAVGSLLGVSPSLTLTETHRSEAIVTELPIENGTVVTDHIHLRPDTVTIDVEVANSSGPFVARGAWAAFKAQLKMRGLYTVLTSHELYTNMALTRLDGENAAPWNGRLLATLTFTEVNLTQLSVTQVPESNVSSGTGAAAGTGTGTDVTKTASTVVESGRVDSVTAVDNAPRVSTAARLLGLGS